MASTTARYGFPYQEATDPPDGAAVGQDLAEAVETSLAAFEDTGHQFIQQVRFTSSGSFTKASYPTAKLARVRVQGGGGAGGGAPSTAAGQISSASGGQGGAYAESLVTTASMATSVTVTVGAAGTGASGTTGNSGGTSSFGATVVAAGGTGGGSVPAGTSLFSGVPGFGSQSMTGDIQIGGQGGAVGARLGTASGQTLPGNGGCSQLGKGGAGGRNAVGEAGKGYGGGGGGSSNDPSGAARVGGDGSIGIVIVDLYG